MRKESKFAIFYFQENDQILIDELIEYLDKNAQIVFEFFEIQTTQKAIINIIPTKIEFDNFIRITRNLSIEEKIPSWLIGTYKDGIITYLSLNDFKNTSHSFKTEKYSNVLEYYKKTILHEFVHFVNALFNAKNKIKFTEQYLSEGIASYLSKQLDGKKLEFNYSKEDLISKKRFNSCYDGWYLLTKYLVDNYDKKLVIELFEDNVKARSFLEHELYNKVKNYYTNNDIKELN